MRENLEAQAQNLILDFLAASAKTKIKPKKP